MLVRSDELSFPYGEIAVGVALFHDEMSDEPFSDLDAHPQLLRR